MVGFGFGFGFGCSALGGLEPRFQNENDIMDIENFKNRIVLTVIL